MKEKHVILSSCLQGTGPKRELLIAALGCLFGTTLLVLALQLFQDANHYLEKNEGPRNYFTLNKKVEGGALINLGKQGEGFSPEELEAISRLEGVRRTGGFVRNQFPVTVYIWPTGRVGMGSAAKADLFFESIPDEFLDFIPKEWDWDENSSFVPIMVPKFYLDLWNFGLAPSRVEYPPLSKEAATGMPIEVFIGQNREATLDGRFVAFSKRINSVLVPERFLTWANRKFGQPDTSEYFFIWKNGAIEGPPQTMDQINGMKDQKDFESWEISPLGDPATRTPVSSITKKSKELVSPSRIILEVANTPSKPLLQFIEENKYELNREFPEQDMIKKALLGLFAGIMLIGALLSLLSIATFATSYRLVIARSADHARNLLLLGFMFKEVSQIFFGRFLKLFSGLLICSILTVYLTKAIAVQKCLELGIELDEGISLITLLFTAVYSLIFLGINKAVIDKSVSKLNG